MHKKQSGFTLIELSLVMILMGIFTVTVIKAYKIYDEKRKYETTDLRLSSVEQAINDFVSINGRLPCAAPRGVDRSSVTYGREEDCTVAPVGTALTAGVSLPLPDGSPAPPVNVRIGMLPTRTLGISDVYMQDSYGASLVYAVTEPLAIKASYSGGGGAIDVLDNTGASRLSAVGYAQYVMVSPGEADFGAYSYSGTLVSACDADRLEGENCDDDAIFVEADLARTVNKSNFFDDKIIYKRRLPVAQIYECEQKTGVLMLGACPSGWEKVTGIGESLNRSTTVEYNVFHEHPDRTGYYFTKTSVIPLALVFGWLENYSIQGTPSDHVRIGIGQGSQGFSDGSGGVKKNYYTNQTIPQYAELGVAQRAILNTKSSSGALPMPSGTNEGQTYCRKMKNNLMPQKCFTEEILIEGDENCPTDFVLTKVKSYGTTGETVDGFWRDNAGGMGYTTKVYKGHVVPKSPWEYTCSK